MKKILILVSLILALVISCSKKEEVFKLEEGVPAYDLALKLSEKVEKLDPVKNEALITTKYFSVTAGETVEGIIQNFGSRASQLADMDTSVIINIIMSNAKAIAEKKLLENEANRSGHKVEQTQIDSIMQLQFDATGGEEAFLKRLAENNIDISTVTKSIKSGILINALLEEKILEDDIIVTEVELKALFKPEKARAAQHILVDTRNDSTDALKAKSKKKIDEVLAKAKLGEDFAELAKKYSDCPSKEQGGDLGKFSQGQMVPEFDKAVFSMNVGEISDIVTTQFGYHVIKLNEIVTNSFEDMKESLKSQVMQQKKNDLTMDYLAKLKEKANFKEITL